MPQEALQKKKEKLPPKLLLAGKEMEKTSGRAKEDGIPLSIQKTCSRRRVYITER